MAMLAHDVERPLRSSQGPSFLKPGAVRLAGIKRVCLGALTVLLAGGGLAAIIALKTAIYFTRFHLG